MTNMETKLQRKNQYHSCKLFSKLCKVKLFQELHKVEVLRHVTIYNLPDLTIVRGDHSFSTYANFSEKLTFLTPPSFSENFVYVLNE